MQHSSLRKSVGSVICLLSLLVVGMAQLQAQTNLIRNPSFEEMDASGKKPKYWQHNIRKHERDPNKITKCSFGFTDQAQEGKTAITIVADKSNPGNTQNMAEWLQAVPVKPNRTYYFSVWFKGIKISNAWLNACVEQRSAKGHYVKIPKGTEVVAKHPAKPKRNQYNMVELVVKTGPKTEQLLISLRFQNMGSGTVYFDNASLIELPNK